MMASGKTSMALPPARALEFLNTRHRSSGAVHLLQQFVASTQPICRRAVANQCYIPCMTIKLFANPASTCTRKVLTVLAETNTPYEFTTVDFATGEHKGAAHMARQPFGQVPAMQDGDFAMYESRAMCRYLNDKAGGKLVPTELQARARMDQWMSIEQSNFTTHAMKFVYHSLMGRPQDEATLAAATTALSNALTIMDKQLTNNMYLAGSEFSLADIGFLPYFEYGMMTPAKELFTAHPHVMAWWTRCSERPSWLKAAGRAS
jgi:glutathione S-transferase